MNANIKKTHIFHTLKYELKGQSRSYSKKLFLFDIFFVESSIVSKLAKNTNIIKKRIFH